MKLSLCRIRGDKTHRQFIIAEEVPDCMEILDTKEVILVQETEHEINMKKTFNDFKRNITYI